MKLSLRHILLLITILMSLLAGCRGAENIDSTTTPSITPESAATETTIPTATATATATPTPTPTPLPLNGQQTQYIIDATINYYNRFITVTSRSIYTNKTNAPIDSLVFIIYPTIFQNSIYIKAVKDGNGSPITNFFWESHRMVIPLETPLMPGEQVATVHDFELYLPNREGTFGQTGRQLNLAYWFPYIPPRNNDGWMTYEISIINSQIVGEYQVFESADFDVSIQFSDRVENFKIAAGATPEVNDDIFHYKMNLARTFTLSISDIFTVTERNANGIKVLSYAFPEDAVAGEAAADIAADAIKLYSEYYGSMERDLVSVVEADFLHGMEFDGLILLSRGFYMFYNGTPETNLTIITPHEISHQWFFSLVGNNQAMEPWLDETLATYSEALFYERYHPDLVAWWWENRVDGMQPSGYVDNTIYLEGGYEVYRNSVYLNGAYFMQDLRNTIGDEAFFDFIKDYIQKNRYEIATSADFWSILFEHTDQDLTSLINDYFRNPPEIP